MLIMTTTATTTTISQGSNMRPRQFLLAFAAMSFYAIVAIDAVVETIQHGLEAAVPTLTVGLAVSVIVLVLVSVQVVNLGRTPA